MRRIKANLDQREAERSYGIPESELTPPASWSAWGLRTHESTRKLARRIQAGTARIRSVTVSFRRGRWHASFSIEVERAERVLFRPGSVVGVDVGITHLAVLSTGQMVPNPRPLEHAQAQLRRLQRQAARRTGPDRLTTRLTTRLAARYGTVVAEDLHVAGMLRNRRLTRRVSDAGFGTLRRQLGYKTTWHGGRLVTAGRFYPSSKTCSGCGAVKAKLRLSERTYRCGSCGLVIDRDLNAARNLAALAALAGGASSPSRGATENEPAGNPGKARAAGIGYRHGKTAPASGDGQRPHRKARAA